jgi:DNA-binding transcriptional LysR family regulator
MLDPIRLDQLRMLAAVVDHGSFSAAARELRRVQSAVSTAMANLEHELGVTLWDRTARELPGVELRVEVQTMSAVASRVLAGHATLGVASQVADAPELERQALAAIRMIPVVAPRHPLARLRGRIARAALAEHVQIVLSERRVDGVPDQGVLSPRTWRVDDLHTKQALLRAGLGWGNLPAHFVRADLRRGQLVAIRPAAWSAGEHTIHLALVSRRDTTLGPAHRWVVERLTALCARALAPGR